MNPNPDFKIGQLSMDRAIVAAEAFPEIRQHFEELKKKYGGQYGDYDNLKVEELTIEDAMMWYRLRHARKGSVPEEELIRYRMNVDMNRNPSRTALAASMAEIFTDMVIEKQNKKDAKK